MEDRQINNFQITEDGIICFLDDGSSFQREGIVESAFIMIGNTDPISLSRKGSMMPWLIVGGLLLVGLIFWGLRGTRKA